MPDSGPADRPNRRESDSMGPMDVPADAYFGASTQRAVLNFPISDLRLGRPFVRALRSLGNPGTEPMRSAIASSAPP